MTLYDGTINAVSICAKINAMDPHVMTLFIWRTSKMHFKHEYPIADSFLMILWSSLYHHIPLSSKALLYKLKRRQMQNRRNIVGWWDLKRCSLLTVNIWSAQPRHGLNLAWYVSCCHKSIMQEGSKNGHIRDFEIIMQIFA